MNGKKKQICLSVLLVTILLTGCSAKKEVAAIAEPGKLVNEKNKYLYVTDADISTELGDAQYIDLSVTEKGFTIENGGEYVLSGSYDETLTIDVHDEIVHLYFDNLNIETTIGPAIYIASGNKVIITLLENTTNTFFDAAYYKDEALNATISSECDLTINGSGTLYVCGYFKDAIHSKDVCKLLGGQIQLMAKRYGIKGNDGIVLQPDYLLIESEKNGCQTSNADKAGKGVIDIGAGDISIISGEYALSSAADVYIRGGKVYLNSVIGNVDAKGQQYIAEGTITYE